MLPKELLPEDKLLKTKAIPNNNFKKADLVCLELNDAIHVSERTHKALAGLHFTGPTLTLFPKFECYLTPDKAATVKQAFIITPR